MEGSVKCVAMKMVKENKINLITAKQVFGNKIDLSDFDKIIIIM
jgi:hypothetical protein